MKKLLLIEDDELQIEWAGKCLEQEDCQLEVARTIEEARGALTRRTFDIVISDLELPVKQGEIPLIENGVSFVKGVLHLLRRKGIKIAIVTDFEHHLHWAKKHKEGVNETIIERNGQRLYKIESELKGYADRVIADLSPWVRYYQNDCGKTVTNEEISKKSEKVGLEWYDFVIANNYKPLKPYKELFSLLNKE